MKKIIAFIIVCFTCFSVTACAKNDLSSDMTSKNTAIEESNASTKSAKKDIPGNNGGIGGNSLEDSEIENKYLNVAYSSKSASQTLNIYLPNEGVGPFPVIVAIHGGAFKMGSATGGDVAAMLEGVEHGYAVVSVNYRLSGEAVFPAAVNDCKAAIRFIKANAKKYNLSADKIAVWGDSAGGNLASMVGTTGNNVILENDSNENMDYSSSVQAVVDWFGPLDFLKMDEQFELSGITPKFGKTSSESSPESQYIGKLITSDITLTQKANPITYIEEMKIETAPSFFIQHGTADSNVPIQQSINFAGKLKEKIGDKKVTIELLEGAGHGTSEFTTTENLEKIFKFLDSILK